MCTKPVLQGKEGFRARQRKKKEVVWREEGQRERERVGAGIIEVVPHCSIHSSAPPHTSTTFLEGSGSALYRTLVSVLWSRILAIL